MTDKEKRLTKAIFQMKVLDYFVMSNDPDRETLGKIYKTAKKLDEISFLKEEISNYKEVWADFDKGLYA